MDKKKPTIFDKITNLFGTGLDVGQVSLQRMISKARSEIASQDDEAIYRKSLYRDTTYAIGSQGYHEKTNRLSYVYQEQIARKNTIIGAIITTYQNKVVAHACPSKDKSTKGFRIILKDEESAIEQLIREIFPDEPVLESDSSDPIDRMDENRRIVVDHKDELEPVEDSEFNPEEADYDGDKKISSREKRVYAKIELQKRIKVKIKALTELILHSGSLKDRPFESQRWEFVSFLKAIVRDSLVFDQIAVEMVPDLVGKPHHWVPVDAGTIRLSSPALRDYQDIDMHQAGYDLLFPEKELKAMAYQRDTLELDPEKLENEDYKYVQVVRGRILRAFTPDELFLGMRNPGTSLYSNGYSFSELEILMNIVSSHIFTENYNRQYFVQGFSAKGILHIKSQLTRRKLESFRTQWQHMIKGNRNSFQTPIMSGVEEIKWIPLTQSHSDMEFSNWMNYLIKVMCAIYQIDPFEIGFGMREEGGRGGGLNGDNTREKIEISRSKGFVPLMRFLERFINRHIIDKLDADFKLEFTGISEETTRETIERQAEEVKFKKTVNEIRTEEDLPPIAGADDLILDQVYYQWYREFHPQGRKLNEEIRDDEQTAGMTDFIAGHDEQDADNVQGQVTDEEQRMFGEVDVVGDRINDQVAKVEEELQPKEKTKKSLRKSRKSLRKSRRIAIEYYKVEEE